MTQLPEQLIQELLEAAVQAPSGDNAQPWRFQVKDNCIRVLNVPEKDTSPFNLEQVSNYIALGAAAENLCVTARSKGYAPQTTFFPDSKNEKVVCEVRLEEDSTAQDSLAAFISERACNRKKYEARAIAPELLEELTRCADTNLRISFISDPERKQQILPSLSVSERIALENREVHDFLFAHVTWSEDEESRKHGFYIKTFEFQPPQEAAFKLFRNWNTLNLFNKVFGISKFIAKDMEKVYASSAAFGAVIGNSASPEGCVKAGMSLQRLWLTATKNGLSLQPTTAVQLLALHGNKLEQILSEEHVQLITERYEVMKNQFQLADEEKILFAFRIGYGGKPSGRTTRFAPIIETLAE